MAQADNEFRKLLSEAALITEPEIFAVTGVLARISNQSKFLLTLNNGQTVKLDVEAVKTAKKIAASVGALVVRLELESKLLTEGMRDILSGWNGIPTGATFPHTTVASLDQRASGAVPFLMAAPHQANPETMEALAYGAVNRTYITAYDWTSDHHTIMKAQADQQ